MFSNVTLFADLSASELELITSHSVTKTYPKNCILINEGDHSDALYVILRGKVKVYVSGDDGREVTLNIQSAGEYFGELALIDDEPCSASVITLEPSFLAVIAKKDFQQCLMQNPRIALQLLRTESKRIRALTESVKNLALLDVYGRVVHTLTKLATKNGKKLVIEQKLTHQDIANMVGASREMVSRIMKDLNTGGYIHVEDKKIMIQTKLPMAW